MSTIKYEVWRAIKANPGCSREVVAKATGIKPVRASEFIQDLRTGGYIITVAPTRKTKTVRAVYYAVKDCPPEGMAGKNPRSQNNLPRQQRKKAKPIVPYGSLILTDLERAWPWPKTGYSCGALIYTPPETGDSLDADEETCCNSGVFRSPVGNVTYPEAA